MRYSFHGRRCVVNYTELFFGCLKTKMLVYVTKISESCNNSREPNQQDSQAVSANSELVHCEMLSQLIS